MRTPETERKGREVEEAEEGSGGDETGFAGQEEAVIVEEEEGDTASTCSLGNLSNLESCQDADTRCTAAAAPSFPPATPPPYPASIHPCNTSEQGGENTDERGFVLIQGKQTLRADRMGDHLHRIPPASRGGGVCLRRQLFNT